MHRAYGIPSHQGINISNKIGEGAGKFSLSVMRHNDNLFNVRLPPFYNNAKLT